MQNHKKGNIYIISAASGTGKTTLVSRLLKNHDDIRVSISHTTRQPREGEVHGVHYHFVPKEEFESLIEQRAFLEHANVFGNYYGTSIAGVNSLSEGGYDVILEIDVQGAAQVRKSLPEASSIFILPPSFEVLAQRLIGRGTDSEEVIQTRLSKARHEIEQSVLFDYVVVNDDLDRAEADLFHIIKAGRLKKSAQQGFISNLLENS
ncbi:guanylate kinase [Neisseria sp. 20925_1_37]|uniref:guanylate kinase n=1 Tax=Neisseria sp. 20925_1_37 TaxID=3003683 RepID=UPI00352BEC8B